MIFYSCFSFLLMLFLLAFVVDVAAAAAVVVVVVAAAAAAASTRSFSYQFSSKPSLRRSQCEIPCLDLSSSSSSRSLDTLSLEDRWILSRCALAARQVNSHLQEKDFHLACRELRKFLYGGICDTYLVGIFKFNFLTISFHCLQGKFIDENVFFLFRNW